MKIDACLSSNTNEWTTPKELFNELNEKYNFTLDPCCTDETNLCKKYYTIKENGLIQDWSNEIVFMNPPYGKEISLWIKKAYEESEKCLVCALIPSRTDTRYFHDYIYNKHGVEITFLKGRLKFGQSKTGAPFPSMIVIFDRRDKIENGNRCIK